MGNVAMEGSDDPVEKKRRVEAAASGNPSKRTLVEVPRRPPSQRPSSESIAASWGFFESMGKPRWHVAPMVDQSELPFRMLCRRYGAECAYTPMLHARLFVEGAKYRREHFTTCAADRPLITQFCANDPQVLLEAARHVEAHCDAVDINFGCPQRIAKKGNYGAFLMDDLDRVHALVSVLAQNLSIPVTCKIRMFPPEGGEDEDAGVGSARYERTLEYARMLQSAGCQLLAVHGRTRDQKRCREIRADWEVIKAVKDALDIPVLANGNVRCLEDAVACMEHTGADGVLSASPLLENPALFAGTDKGPCDLLDEYLDLVEEYPTAMRMVRAHVHQMLGAHFTRFPDVRQRMNESIPSVKLFKDVNAEVRRREVEASQSPQVNG